MNNKCIMCHQPIPFGAVVCDICHDTMTVQNAKLAGHCRRCTKSIGEQYTLCVVCSKQTDIPMDGEWTPCAATIAENGATITCRRYGECHVIYGCLDAHVTDMTMCRDHARMWWRWAKGGSLYCDMCQAPAAELAVSYGDGEQAWLDIPERV